MPASYWPAATTLLTALLPHDRIVLEASGVARGKSPRVTPSYAPDPLCCTLRGWNQCTSGGT